MGHRDVRNETVAELSKGFPREIVGPRTVGTEEELLLVSASDCTMGSTKAFFDAWDHPGWQPVVRSGQFEAIRMDGLGMITTDAGLGTLEVNVEKSETLHDLKRKKNAIISKIVDVAGRTGMRVLGSGIHPVTAPHADLWQPKERYALIIRRFSPEVHMATVTASTQTHVAIARHEVPAITTAMNAITGALIALSANSSVWQGAVDPQERSAIREGLWDNFCDPHRVGIPPIPFPTFESYVDTFLDRELFLHPDARLPDVFSFCSEPLRKVLAANNHTPDHVARTIAAHESTLWWDARPRSCFGTIEVRPCCQQPQDADVAVAALTLGAVQRWKSIKRFIDCYDWNTWSELRSAAIKYNLEGKTRDLCVRDVARFIVTEALGGLYDRNFGEEVYLSPMIDRAWDRKPVPAVKAANIFREKGIEAYLEAFAYKG